MSSDRRFKYAQYSHHSNHAHRRMWEGRAAAVAHQYHCATSNLEYVYDRDVAREKGSCVG